MAANNKEVVVVTTPFNIHTSYNWLWGLERDSLLSNLLLCSSMDMVC